MHLAQPLWLIAGLTFCLGMFLLNLHLERKRGRVLEKFAAGHLVGRLTGTLSRRKRTLKLMLLLAVFFFCFTALARPQYGHRWIDVKRRGIDILFAVDTSASMMTGDIRPNRLARSKFAIVDFVDQLEGDRVGLMPFAGTAFLMCPLTIDYQAFEETLQALDSGVIPDAGTNLATAIDYAGSILANDANHKILIIVTDGENLEGDVAQAAKKAAEEGMTIFTVGVGTAEGELVPAAGEEGGFLKDDSGQFVISRLDETSLKQIANVTGGLYAPLGIRGEGLERIYRQKLKLIPKEELAEKRRKVPIERFHWFLGIAFALLTLEFLIGGRKNSTAAVSLRHSLKKQTLVILLPPLLLTLPMKASASPGEEAFLSGDFQTAEQIYRQQVKNRPDDARLNYNLGTAAYKNGELEEAIASFDKALRSDDLTLQEQAYFNRGNAQYRAGEGTLQGDPQNTISHWRNAVESYTGALQLSPDNERARHNLELVRKKLDQLEQQQNSSRQSRDGDGNREEQKKDREEQQKDSSSDNGKNNQEDQSAGDKHNLRNGERSDAQQRPGDEQKSDTSDQPSERTAEQQHSVRMTQEEAVQLLKEMESEEGVLRFVPQPDTKKDSSEKTGKNW